MAKPKPTHTITIEERQIHIVKIREVAGSMVITVPKPLAAHMRWKLGTRVILSGSNHGRLQVHKATPALMARLQD